MDYFKAPSVQEFGNNMAGDEGLDSLLPHLGALVVRSGCTLRTLLFDGAPNAVSAASTLQNMCPSPNSSF
jgi:hypothetical protein